MYVRREPHDGEPARQYLILDLVAQRLEQLGRLVERLASRIVDLVSTGKTLKDNGLVETSVILEISARLIVNRAALKTDERVAALVDRFRALVAETKAAA